MNEVRPGRARQTRCHHRYNTPPSHEPTSRPASRWRQDMDPAWIAVIGTLGGVIVTATSAVAVASLTTRSQRLTLDRQRDHDLSEHRRAERRETFIDYPAAYSELRQKILALNEQPPPHAAHLAEQFPVEVARFSRAYQALRIFSNPTTGQAAHDCSSHLWSL